MLKLQLPALPEPLEIKCEVAWVRKESGAGEGGLAGMGVKFVEMNKKDDQTLKKYLNKIMKEGE